MRLGLLIETTASARGVEFDACDALSAKLAHAEYPGQQHLRQCRVSLFAASIEYRPPV